MNLHSIFISDLVLDQMIKGNKLDPNKKELVQEILLSRHKRLHDKKKKNKGLPYNASFDGTPGERTKGYLYVNGKHNIV